MTLLVVVLFVFVRPMSQTADENISSSAGMFQCCILLSCSFFFYICIAIRFSKNAADLKQYSSKL